MARQSPIDTPQLPLTLGAKDSAAFESFLPGPNREPWERLRQLAVGSPGIYLWGEPGTGKTHLLAAACHGAGHRGEAAVYLPMDPPDQFPSALLDGLEQVDLVCIDDIQRIAGREEWELALTRLLQRLADTGAALAVAGDGPPAGLGLRCSHLESRLGGLLVYRLRELDDGQRLEALQLRSARRGFKLPDEVGRYLLRRCDRSMAALFAALDALDRASLAAQRKLTVPFVRSVLKEAGLAMD